MQPNRSTPLSRRAELALQDLTPLVLPGNRDGSDARHGPLFDWFEDRFSMLNWTIPADRLGPGLPPRDMRPRMLLRFLLEDADYPQRDQIWAAVITGARRPATAEPYRLLAISLAARGLRRSRKRVVLAHRDDTADIDHDLLYGFLKRMTTIDIRATNLGMKLIESGITHAKGRQSRPSQQPRKPRKRRPPAPMADSTPDEELSILFHEFLAALAVDGRPLAERDVKLLTITGFDHGSMKEAADQLGMSLETAYKQRQRAKARFLKYLAARDREPDDEPAGGVHGKSATGRGATASAEAAEASTRRTAPHPDPRRSTRRSAPRAPAASSDHDRSATPHGFDPTPPTPDHPTDPPH
ncbi:hypothetical protein SAMN04489716_5419 [Actinoplanes derwentensis]|uniref:DNA-directed RNA polymerase specialized sigma subunit, sigma24 family n=1 Tax=Actinoplanes derwentensis TaxID=113562 RepID=A0A1H2CAD2_9ACTN|nr:hypothetical protein SAMN04489716_5419 [Actinoplanes derwentensis]